MSKDDPRTSGPSQETRSQLRGVLLAGTSGAAIVLSAILLAGNFSGALSENAFGSPSSRVDANAPQLQNKETTPIQTITTTDDHSLKKSESNLHATKSDEAAQTSAEMKDYAPPSPPVFRTDVVKMTPAMTNPLSNSNPQPNFIQQSQNNAPTPPAMTNPLSNSNPQPNFIQQSPSVAPVKSSQLTFKENRTVVTTQSTPTSMGAPPAKNETDSAQFTQSAGIPTQHQTNHPSKSKHDEAKITQLVEKKVDQKKAAPQSKNKASHHSAKQTEKSESKKSESSHEKNMMEKQNEPAKTIAKRIQVLFHVENDWV